MRYAVAHPRNLRRLSRLWVAAGLGLFAVAAGPIEAGAQDAQGDSAAVAVNMRDGSSVFRLSFSVKRIMDSDVDADNAAVAYASCTECQTVAASIQVVLAMADTDSLTTDNVAIAINYQCSECDTLAAAYQFVFGNGEHLRFSAEGSRMLADIRRRLQELRTSEMTLEQLASEMDKLATETLEVVRTELVEVPPPPTGTESASTTTTTTTAPTPTTTTTTTTTASVSTTTSSAPSTSTTTSATTTTTLGTETTTTTTSTPAPSTSSTTP